MTRLPVGRAAPPSLGFSTLAFSSLTMYPFERLRASWDRLYGAVAAQVPGAPRTLLWDRDPHDTWRNPNLALGMTCGWPLVTKLLEHVRVVGTFAYDIEGVVGHTSRSVIIARSQATISDLRGATFAFNSTDSLSGYVSMMSLLADDLADPVRSKAGVPDTVLPDTVLPDTGKRWPGPTIETGAHVASIEAVRAKVADTASIDGLTWAFTERDDPAFLDGLVVIGRGPEVPHLPLIVPMATSDDVLAGWRSALADVAQDESMRATLVDLAIAGFVPLDASDYVSALGPLIRADT